MVEVKAAIMLFKSVLSSHLTPDQKVPIWIFYFKWLNAPFLSLRLVESC